MAKGFSQGVQVGDYSETSVYQFPRHQHWLKFWRRRLHMRRDWITIDKLLDVAQALFFTANLTVKYV